MGFQKFGQHDMHFIADTKEDLKDLPSCSMGSTCYIISEATEYMRNSAGEWVSQTKPAPITPTPGGGEGGNEGPSIEELAEIFAAKEELLELQEQIRLEELKKIKYEVSNLPEGSLVDYREKEIRIMCPENAEWEKQQVGEGGNPNMYYFTFKAYAPEGAVSFKEDDLAEIEDQTMYYFENNTSAGIDKYGRKYSICWLAAAANSNEVWTYFGKNSTREHMIGFYYTVEWYDADGDIIGMDSIKINLTNKACHTMIEPYYVSYIDPASWDTLPE